MGFLEWVKRHLKWEDITDQRRSETLNYRKKAIDYALDKFSPMIQNVGSQALDQLSTKIRLKKNCKTNRKDLDGGALDIHKAIGTYQDQQTDERCRGIGIQGLNMI